MTTYAELANFIINNMTDEQKQHEVAFVLQESEYANKMGTIELQEEYGYVQNLKEGTYFMNVSDNMFDEEEG
jgi:hypothetical protein